MRLPHLDGRKRTRSIRYALGVALLATAITIDALTPAHHRAGTFRPARLAVSFGSPIGHRGRAGRLAFSVPLSEQDDEEDDDEN